MKLAGYPELFFEDFLLSDSEDRAVETRGHLVERLLELAYLVAPTHRNTNRKLAPTHCVGGSTELIDRTTEAKDHEERHDDGQGIDAEQNTGDGDETGPDGRIHLR